MFLPFRASRSLVRGGGGLLTALCLTTVLVGPASANLPAFDSGCPNDLVTEQGTCAQRIVPTPLTAQQRFKRATKAADLARVRRALSAGYRSARTAFFPHDPPVFPRTYVVTEVENMRLFKEGEGNGNKTYTCGPSATRNMIAALYKRQTGHYKDFGEHYFETTEGTTPAGTGRANIVSALNKDKKFKNQVPWATSRPNNSTDYLAHVITSTHLLGRAVIANVDTEYLVYMHHHELRHFNLVFGYDLQGAHDPGHKQTLRIGEEWSAHYSFTNPRTGRPTTYNPYGKHWEPVGSAFKAINASSAHGIVF